MPVFFNPDLFKAGFSNQCKVELNFKYIVRLFPNKINFCLSISFSERILPNYNVCVNTKKRPKYDNKRIRLFNLMFSIKNARTVEFTFDIISLQKTFKGWAL